jgi:hypothetical protein
MRWRREAPEKVMTSLPDAESNGQWLMIDDAAEYKN